MSFKVFRCFAVILGLQLALSSAVFAQTPSAEEIKERILTHQQIWQDNSNQSLRSEIQISLQQHLRLTPWNDEVMNFWMDLLIRVPHFSSAFLYGLDQARLRPRQIEAFAKKVTNEYFESLNRSEPNERMPAVMLLSFLEFGAEKNWPWIPDLILTLLADQVRYREGNRLLNIIIHKYPEAISGDLLFEIARNKEHHANRAAVYWMANRKVEGWEDVARTIIRTQPDSPATPLAMCQLATHCEVELWGPEALFVLSREGHRAFDIATGRLDALLNSEGSQSCKDGVSALIKKFKERFPKP